MTSLPTTIYQLFPEYLSQAFQIRRIGNIDGISSGNRFTWNSSATDILTI